MTEILARIRRSHKRRPARTKRRRWPYVAAAAAALVAVAWASWVTLDTVVHADALRTRELRVTGLERLYDEDVRAVAGDARGAPILRYDIDGLRERVERLPGVGGAVVARRLPDMIEIRVRERVAVARIEIRRRTVLVDAEGRLFPAPRALPGDDSLPRIRGVETGSDTDRLAPADASALRALEALVEVTGRRPPAGTVVDMTPKDRILLRPGPDAPALWLDRDHPEQNLENLFVWKESVTRVAGGREIDLRFPDRLTVVTGEDDGEAR